MHRASRIRRPSEDGFTMVAVIFLLALFAIAMAVAAPEMAKQIQLDREHETMERGKQYVRAIQLYYRKFHAYPPSIKALLDTDNIRFLRQQYKDPLTGKDDWRIIHFGQAKVPPMGFFGQPLAGSPTAIAGTGPSGGNTQQGGSMLGGTDSGFGGGMGSTLGGSTGSSLGGSSLFGSGTGTTTGTTGSTDQSGTSTTGGSSTTGTGSSGSSMFGSGSGDQTFGGAGIIGVAPKSTKESLMIYHKQDHYNMWEFVYNPLTDIQTTGGGMVGQPVNGNSNSNSNSPFGTTGSGSSDFGNSGFGNSGFGNSGSGSSTFGNSGFGDNGGGASPTPQ
jgi:type II secretory pathway pseudopilin PulG